MTTRKNDAVVAETIKKAFHPTLMYILSAVLVYYVTSIQTDVKSLLAQSSADKAEIANLKDQVENLNKVVFMSKYHVSNKVQVADSTAYYAYIGDITFKHEEEYDVKKFLPRRI